jgi:transketolase
MATEVSLRDTYGKTLVELGRENRDIVVLDADLSSSTMTKYFAKEFPERFFNVGIAEQNLVSMAAGFAAAGKIPFASTFAVFLPGRSFDQVRMSVAQPHLNVKLCPTHSGITVGEDGMSHQAIEDLAMMQALPGFTILVPADAIETAQMVRFAAATKGPFYIRLVRVNLPLVNDENYRFELGKAVQLREGNQATIIAIGVLVVEALAAADILAQEGIVCRVLNMATVKPIDRAAIVRAARETGCIVTAEDHLVHGGLGSTVAQVLAEESPAPMAFVGLKDTYARSGKPRELLEKYELTAPFIAAAVRRLAKQK